MTIVNTHQAKTHLSQLLDRAAEGEEIIIAKAGKPIARLVSLAQEQRRGGQWQGLIQIEGDFDQPLPDEVGDAFRSPTP